MNGIAQAASHFRDGSLFNETHSTIDELDFEFDYLLINTAAYRRALISHLRQSKTRSSSPPGIQREPVRTDGGINNPAGILEETEDLIDLSSVSNFPLTDSLSKQVALTPGQSQLEELVELSKHQFTLSSGKRHCKF
jgi:hypothetical protein